MRLLAFACSLALMFVGLPAQAETVLRYGISLADIPLTTGQPDRGAGAYQFTGLTIYDPLVAWAFREDVNPLGARLRPVLGSDISHWDVRRMTDPIEEAFELVEHGVITDRDFRELTFVNPVRLHGSANPRFFEGTVCEDAAAGVLSEES